MRLMDENYQTKYIKWFTGQSVGYTGVPMSQEEAEKCVLKEMPEPYYNPNHNVSKREIYNKLGQLEDLEEELGIELVTKDRVERADEVYSKFYDEYIDDFTLHRCGVEINNRYDASGNNHILLYKDYGKTWALTREELEK